MYLTDSSHTEVHLENGRNSNEGTVVIYHGHRSGSICDKKWNDNDAKVVCRMLGLP